MEYRKVGRSGLDVSALSLGMATFGDGVETAEACAFIAAAFDAGINYFDTGEVYAGSRSEQMFGEALRQLKPDRLTYVITTKFQIGLTTGPNQSRTLNRKYLLHAIDGSLQRMGLDYVDIVHCHWPDPLTPLEETVWAMHNIIEQGKALYWGTSNFAPEQIRAAWEIADRHHLHKPIVEQSEFNLLCRRRVLQDMKHLTDTTGIGVTAYSALAGGLLTGKYRHGTPPGSRATQEHRKMFQPALLDKQRNDIAGGLQVIADDLGTNLTAFSLAWCLTNPQIASVILGVTKPEHLSGSLEALDVVPKLTPEVLQRINETLGGYDQPWMPF